MEASYRGETGADYDDVLDTIAAVCAAADLYARDELQVPAELIS